MSNKLSRYANQRCIHSEMLMKRLRNGLQRLALRFRHKNCADADGDGGGTAEEKVDAKGGLSQKDGGDESDKEVGNLDIVSMM